MPRIVNGEVVNDDTPKRPANERHVFTWRDISSNNVPARHQNEQSVRNRASDNKPNSEPTPKVEVQPGSQSIIEMFGNMLGTSQYKVKIPQDNPKIIIDSTFFVFFLVFAFLFGWKMAV